MSPLIVILICTFVAITDFGLAYYFWQKSQKEQATLEAPGSINMTAEERTKAEKKIKSLKIVALNMAMGGVMIPAIVGYSLLKL